MNKRIAAFVAASVLVVGGMLAMASPAMAGERGGYHPDPPEPEVTSSISLPVIDCEAGTATTTTTTTTREYVWTWLDGKDEYAEADTGYHPKGEWVLGDGVDVVTTDVRDATVIECPPPGEEPEVTTVTPGTPNWVNVCDGPDYWNYQDGEGYSFNGLPSGELVLTAAEGYEFPEGTTTWWQGVEDNADCPPAPPGRSVAATPTAVDFCGFDKDGVNYGASQFGTWKIASRVDMGNGTDRWRVVFTPNPGYLLPETGSWDKIVDGKAVWLLYVPNDQRAECTVYENPPPPTAIEVVTPIAPTSSDPCGPNNVTWMVVETEGVVWTVIRLENGGSRATASPAEGYAFPEGAQTIWNVEDSNVACTSPAPTPTTPLAETGGGEVSPLVPLAGGLATALGVVLAWMGAIRRRMA